MDNVPSNFDWVTARNACSTRKVFEELKLGVMDDISAVNSLRGRLIFNVAANSAGDVLSVFSEDETNSQRIIFRVSNREIVIEGSSEIPLSVTLALNSNGQCKLKINGKEEELFQWQIRMLVLEKLFFGTP
jgi:hypothetical protein